MSAIVLFSVFVLLSALLILNEKYTVQNKEGESRVIGSKQAAVIDAYQQAEFASLYANQAALFSAERAVIDTANKNSECGTYLGYSVWKSSEKECYPSKEIVSQSFETAFKLQLNRFTSQYPGAALAPDAFTVTVLDKDGLRVIGKTSEEVVLNFGSSSLPVCEGGDISKLSETTIKKCSPYHSLFSQKSAQNIQYAIDPLLVESLAYRESGCDPEVNAGGIMQVDKCLLTTTAEARETPALWSCPTPEVQIDEGTKELSTTINAFKEARPADALTLALFAYNRGIATATQAQNFLDEGIPIEQAMYRACTEFFLKQKSTDYRGYTWEESFPLRKEKEPDRYRSYESAVDYYCIKTGPAYPAGIYKTYEETCTQLGGSISRTGNSFQTYAFKPSFKTKLDYSFDEYVALSSVLPSITEELTQSCIQKTNSKERDDCYDDVLSKRTDFKFTHACGSEEETIGTQFIETLLLCSASPSEGYCSYDIPKGKATVTLQRDSGMLLATTGNIQERLSQSYAYVSHDASQILPTSCEKIIVTINNGAATVAIANCANKADETISYSGTISIHAFSQGRKTSSLAIAHPSFAREKTLPPIATIPKQLRLCAQSKYSMRDANNTLMPIIYKIAVHVGDSVPPKPVANIILSDTKDAEHNVTVLFDTNEEKDMSHYNVYYSQNAFTKTTDEGVLFSKQVPHTNLDVLQTTINISGDGTFHVAVVPVDTSSNENTAVTSQVVISVDDVNPGPVQNIAYAKAAGNAPIIDIKITPPVLNEDMTVLGDLVGYALYVKETTGTTCGTSSIASVLQTNPVVHAAIDMSAQIHETQIELPDRNKNYCFVAIALDEVPESIVKSSQYADSSIIFVSLS